jgi:nitroreductase
MHPTGLAGLAQLGTGEMGLWHGAPTVILLLVDTRGAGHPHIDVGIAGQNMVLAAHSMGLGTCWVSFAMFLERSKKYREAFGIRYPMRLASSLALGFPVGQPDGFVARETHETSWFEAGGERRVVY